MYDPDWEAFDPNTNEWSFEVLNGVVGFFTSFFSSSSFFFFFFSRWEHTGKLLDL